MGSLKKLSPNYERKIFSSCEKYKDILGGKRNCSRRCANLIFENIYYECLNNLRKNGEAKASFSPKYLMEKTDCKKTTFWTSIKEIKDKGLINIEKNIKIEVKGEYILTHVITLSDFESVFENNNVVSISSKFGISSSNSGISSSNSGQHTPSQALIYQGFTEISDSPTVLQHITTYINPLSPLNENIPTAANLNTISATANALAGEQEKSIDGEKIQLTLESVLYAGAEPPPGNKKSRRKIDYEDSFEQWWKLYPIHQNKHPAFRKFKGALKKIPFDELMEATKAYVVVREREIENDPRKKDSHRYTSHPETWLNNQRWEDEPVQIELEKRKAKTLPGTYQPSSEEIKIMSKSEFDRRVKEVLVKILPTEKYKSWIESTDFEAIGFDQFNDLEFKANNKFSENYIQSNFLTQLERSFNEAKTSLQQDNYAIQ